MMYHPNKLGLLNRAPLKKEDIQKLKSTPVDINVLNKLVRVANPPLPVRERFDQLHTDTIQSTPVRQVSYTAKVKSPEVTNKLKTVAFPRKKEIIQIDSSKERYSTMEITGIDFIPPLTAGMINNAPIRQHSTNFKYTSFSQYCNWVDKMYLDSVGKGGVKIRGMNGDVFDQGKCGDCWAISSAGSLEDRIAIQNNNAYVSLDPAYLMGCDYFCGVGDCGCDGGFISNGSKYIVEHGITSGCFSPETCFNGCDYPPVCPTDKCPNGNQFTLVKVAGYGGLIDIASIQNEIRKNGPVCNGFAVYHDFMDLASSAWVNGIYMRTPSKNNPEGAHAVVCVGWGTDTVEFQNKSITIQYWIVRNSWGNMWNKYNTVNRPDGSTLSLPGFFKIAFSNTGGTNVNSDIGFDNQTSSELGNLGGGVYITPIGIPIKDVVQLCHSNIDCGLGELCINGTCIKGSCIQNSDCKDNQICLHNECIAKQECTVSSDCGVGYVCQENKCVKDTPKPSDFCLQNNDCNSQQICENNKCVQKKSNILIIIILGIIVFVILLLLLLKVFKH